MTARPRRVWVVGSSGAGKTTFARAAAARLGVPHVELDEVYWDAGWRHRDQDEARARLAQLLGGAGALGWVADGNWNSRGHGLGDAADVVVWLDPPRRVVVTQLVLRTVRRGVTRTELWHGNRENVLSLLRRDPDRNIVRWSWTHFERYREQYGALADRDARVVRIGTRREAAAWLAALEPPAPGGPPD
ncbi:toxin [Cellulomonas uda]|uniref:toxin n=2 Tax=Cellulomonas uda TaxID=1714 RepID=UPI00141B1CFF|nr:toxin [Cellulomonas uda]NII67007.1 adenylate kinase family enzyme [Cellulomonas uda]